MAEKLCELRKKGGNAVEGVTYEYYASYTQLPAGGLSFKPQGAWCVSYSYGSTTVTQTHTPEMGNDLRDVRDNTANYYAITNAGYNVAADGTISRNNFTNNYHISVMY